MQSRYSIKEIEQLSGIKAHTIRAWENRYDLIFPHRTPTNIRYYDDTHLKKVLNIAMLVKSGMKIGQLAKMTDEELLASVASVGKYHNPYDSQINRLKLAMLEYDEITFHSVFNSCFIRYGVEETLDKVMGVFLQEIGVLWQTGVVKVGNEHFVSNLIKMKLLSLIEDLPPVYDSKSKKALLFLPSGELHELSLLYIYYHLKQQGCRVIYLGQSTPLEYVREVSRDMKVDFFVSVCTTQPHFEEVAFYFERIEELFDLSKERFFLTGPQCCEVDVPGKSSGIELVSEVGSLKSQLLQLL